MAEYYIIVLLNYVIKHYFIRHYTFSTIGKVFDVFSKLLDLNSYIFEPRSLNIY